MSQEKIYIGIPKKQIEKEIEKIVREYARKLVSYPYVKNVFFNELQNYSRYKLKGIKSRK